jgi:hypothetical protein
MFGELGMLAFTPKSPNRPVAHPTMQFTAPQIKMPIPRPIVLKIGIAVKLPNRKL